MTLDFSKEFDLHFFARKMHAVFSELSLSGNLVFGLVRLKCENKGVDVKLSRLK
jgi:hypothetical protein